MSKTSREATYDRLTQLHTRGKIKTTEQESKQVALSMTLLAQIHLTQVVCKTKATLKMHHTKCKSLISLTAASGAKTRKGVRMKIL